MKAMARAPPEISANNTSGRLLAALNVSSSWMESAYWREIIPTRTNASTLSIKKKNAMISDVRARNDNLFIVYAYEIFRRGFDSHLLPPRAPSPGTLNDCDWPGCPRA